MVTVAVYILGNPSKKNGQGKAAKPRGRENYRE